MEQEELEQKAKELFTEQGLEVEDRDSRFYVKEPDLSYKVFSSRNYTVEEVRQAASEVGKVFVDEGLAEIDELENVSVMKDGSEKEDLETPSYEMIGDIAVISELPNMEEEEAVESILAHHPNTKTILLKENGLKGEFRVGDYRKLYGEETETAHTEFGCDLLVDPTEVYFSERFSTERDRVVSKIKNGENVLVMFAGVGPFAILAADNAPASKVMGIEKNPAAAEYFRRNVELNGLEDQVEVIEGDVKDEIDSLDGFDRIVMPLPGSADDFLEDALRHSNKDGIVHYYRFLEDKNWDGLVQEVETAAKNVGVEASIEDKTVCGQRGPSIDRVCLDVKID